jgi:hypothetical protein
MNYLKQIQSVCDKFFDIPALAGSHLASIGKVIQVAAAALFSRGAAKLVMLPLS